MKNMKWFCVLLMASVCGRVGALETNQITSDVYAWDRGVNGTPLVGVRSMVGGAATDFVFMNIMAFTLGKGPLIQTTGGGTHPDAEQMIIVKEGSLKITINGVAKTVGRGSVAIIMPGDTRSFSNAADGETTYYDLTYRSKNPPDAERGKKAGGSFVMDWNDVKYIPRDDGKGGTRQFFSRATVMGQRMDLHATTLNPGQASHDPHHHRAEEMIIMLEGDVEEYLGPAEKDGKSKRATDGDIIYLVSNGYHGIKNVGTRPALYFAFQFE
jgi:(S)-ureidoglycine aminohydrolase